jgi:hypothetical protein
MYRIPSELRSQTGLGWTSTQEGDHRGTSSVVSKSPFLAVDVGQKRDQQEAADGAARSTKMMNNDVVLSGAGDEGRDREGEATSAALSTTSVVYDYYT